MSGEHSKQTKRNNNLPLMGSITILVILTLGYFSIPAMEQGIDEAWNVLTSSDQDKIHRWVNDFGWWGPAVIILTMIFQTFLLFVPTVAMMIVTVLAYGPWWGSLLAFVAVVLASSIGYIV